LTNFSGNILLAGIAYALVLQLFKPQQEQVLSPKEKDLIVMNILFSIWKKEALQWEWVSG